MKYSLSISGDHYDIIKNHLFPGDGFEAIAVALCGRHKTDGSIRLLTHKILPIPYDRCEIRNPGYVKWSTEMIVPLLVEAQKYKFSLITIHSHPTGFNSFSSIDDACDLDLCESFYGWVDDEGPHGSAVMLPDGSIFGRVWNFDKSFTSFDSIKLVGDDLKFWTPKKKEVFEQFSKRTLQVFGEKTTSLLKDLKIAVIGASGTGSVVIEQLFRLGVGELILVDPDIVEEKNLNRILNTKRTDAIQVKYKVNVLKDFIDSAGINTKVKAFNENLYNSRQVLNEVIDCDVIFGCVDSIDGRHLINQISTFYLIPYFDVGVYLNSDGKGGIDVIYSVVQYLKPGGSSLLSRNFYTSEELRSAGLFRNSQSEYHHMKRIGYIADLQIDNPTVITINMQAATFCVNEFLARIHPFRYEDNASFAITRINTTGSYVQYEGDGVPDEFLAKFVGRGLMKPFLNMPELT